MSPSEAENSSKSITFGPRIMPVGSTFGAALRAMVIMASWRRRRSMICGETLPPPLPRTSTIRPSLCVCGIVALDELVQPVGPMSGMWT